MLSFPPAAAGCRARRDAPSAAPHRSEARPFVARRTWPRSSAPGTGRGTAAAASSSGEIAPKRGQLDAVLADMLFIAACGAAR